MAILKLTKGVNPGIYFIACMVETPSHGYVREILMR